MIDENKVGSLLSKLKSQGLVASVKNQGLRINSVNGVGDVYII
jgi:secreted Zn-dependent insulinase-like peptidase